MGAKELYRAECIGESFENFKVFPIIGEPSAVLGKGGRYSHFFDAMFVSVRQAQFMQSEVASDPQARSFGWHGNRKIFGVMYEKRKTRVVEETAGIVNGAKFPASRKVPCF